MVIPQRNRQFGQLMGGSWVSTSYRESVIDYAMTEGGIDYNAGLVGALAYIVSKVAPADTAAFNGSNTLRQSYRNDNFMKVPGHTVLLGMLSGGYNKRTGSAGWANPVYDLRGIRNERVQGCGFRVVQPFAVYFERTE
jgi:hypothetical protein